MSDLNKIFAGVVFGTGLVLTAASIHELNKNTLITFEEQYQSISAHDAEQLSNRDKINDVEFIATGLMLVLSGVKQFRNG